MVNFRPLVPGHVLIISRRRVPRLSELNTEEVSDLFRSVQLVGKFVEKVYNSQALTIALQDGIAAGQTVPVSSFIPYYYPFLLPNAILVLFFFSILTCITYFIDILARTCSCDSSKAP